MCAICDGAPSLALVRFQRFEPFELLQRRRELAGVRALLIAREQHLAELRAAIVSFEGRYIRQVGLLYRRLDEWERKLAELRGVKAASEVPTSEEVDESDYPEVDPVALKTIFRDLVRLLHPDYAVDKQDEQRRTRLMALANEAYAREDMAAIRRMLHGYDPGSAPSVAESAHDEVVRLTAAIFQATQDVEAINLQVEELQRSESAKLQQRVLAAAQQGRDLLAEMAARVSGSIGLAMRSYELELSRKARPSRGLAVETLLSAEIEAE